MGPWDAASATGASSHASCKGASAGAQAAASTLGVADSGRGSSRITKSGFCRASSSVGKRSGVTGVAGFCGTPNMVLAGPAGGAGAGKCPDWDGDGGGTDPGTTPKNVLPSARVLSTLAFAWAGTGAGAALTALLSGNTGGAGNFAGGIMPGPTPNMVFAPPATWGPKLLLVTGQTRNAGSCSCPQWIHIIVGSPSRSRIVPENFRPRFGAPKFPNRHNPATMVGLWRRR